jgi:integrase
MAITKFTHSRGTSYQMTIRVNGRLVRRRFPTKAQATDEYARLRHAGVQGTFLAPADAKITFAAYAATWFAGLSVRPSTMANYRSHYRMHLEPAFGSQRLDRITRQQVLVFLVGLREKNLKPATVRGIYNQLRTICRSAVHDRQLVASPCYKISMPKVPPKKLAFFTPDQVDALLANATARDYAVLATAVGTGLRQGELLGLTRAAVDLDRAELTVALQMMTPVTKGMPHLTGDLKTAAAYRVLPLPTFVVDALRSHLEAYGTGQDGLLFPNRKGAGWRRGSFNDSVWKPALRRAGLPSGYGIHACRHTYASILIAAGQNALVIMARLGHASIVETMDTYGHLFPQQHAETTAVLDQAFGRTNRRLRAV